MQQEQEQEQPQAAMQAEDVALKQNTVPPSLFYESKVFKELNEVVATMLAGNLAQSAILIYGPQGCGKTSSLLKLCSDNITCGAKYVDLTSSNIDRLSASNKQYTATLLFVDNAQNYGQKVSLNLHWKYLVAAFSPGGGINESARVLRKDCGDGMTRSFYFRPLNYTECEDFVKLTENKTIVDESSSSMTTIHRSDFDECYFWSNGAPRYIQYFLANDKGLMWEGIQQRHIKIYFPETAERLLGLVNNTIPIESL